MAERAENQQAAINAVLDEVVKLVKDVQNANGAASVEHKSAAVRNLAEAFAWLKYPSQPHGGSAGTPSS